MRRLPIYFLIDVSESMVGEPIIQVEKGMRNIIQELRTDPYALETVFVSVIVFAGKEKVLSPLTELYKFYPPQFPIGGGTSLGTALDCPTFFGKVIVSFPPGLTSPNRTSPMA